MTRRAFLIAAPSSGSGKTTVTLGLLRALRRRSLSVSPMKTGPDYIDTQFHAIAAGRPSVNLDLFMSTPEQVSELFGRRSAPDGGVTVVEGAMGLFDGYDAMRGSSAEVAALLRLPIILVVDGAHAAYSVAPLLRGLASWRADVDIRAVIFNRVGSKSHESILRRAADDASIECIGCIPRSEGVVTPSRHLGLTLTARAEMDRLADAAADLMERSVDIDRLLRLASFEPADSNSEHWLPKPRVASSLRIAVARDEAFCFTYDENLLALERYGSITYFSPIHDSELPEADLLYLPGGYPELYARELCDNRPMRRAIADRALDGGATLAECGGLIYLCRDIDGIDLCGVLPMSATMADARLSLGYRRLQFADTTLGEIRGHEFHYSRLRNPDALPSVAQQFTATGRPVATPLYRVANTIAGYTHLYWPHYNLLSLFDL